jgi:hypothetical protein
VIPSGGSPPPRRPSNLQVFLGLFILWQLFFLFWSNFLGYANSIRDDEDYQEKLPQLWYDFVEHCLGWRLKEEGLKWMKKEGHLDDACKTIRGLTDRWEELTNQPQNWSLFAPQVGREVTFVAVELRWDRPAKSGKKPGGREAPVPYAPELLLSENEPADPARFFRVGRFRLRKYESNLDVILREDDDETEAETRERWRKRIRGKVEREWDTIPAYLKLRCRAYLAEHPDRPRPRQVILLVRQYTIPAPGEFSRDWYRAPRSMKMARWQPGVSFDSGYEVEVWNPVTERFEEVSK